MSCILLWAVFIGTLAMQGDAASIATAQWASLSSIEASMLYGGSVAKLQAIHERDMTTVALLALVGALLTLVASLAHIAMLPRIRYSTPTLPAMYMPAAACCRVPASGLRNDASYEQVAYSHRRARTSCCTAYCVMVCPIAVVDTALYVLRRIGLAMPCAACRVPWEEAPGSTPTVQTGT
ncbi:MAG: hypothetical protein EOO41_03450 [Methanobacteriota archaeon]|nr:MAG: hypothetical protein EOO41_03450 [Euryarchaeota archaeon]